MRSSGARHWVVGLVWLVVGWMLAGCTLQVAPPAGDAALPGAGKTLRLLELSNVAVRSVPALMAMDALRAQGYTVELTYLSNSSLMAEALARGDADLGRMNNQTMWNAIAKGVEARTVVQSFVQRTVFTARADIPDCAQLDGRPVGLANATGLSPALLTLYLAENCGGAQPEYLVIPESAGRIAALLAGELDAATLPGEEYLELQQSDPTGFQTVYVQAEAFPEVQIDGWHARTDADPDAVRAFIRALLESHRAVMDDPALLYAEAAKRLEISEEEAKTLADFNLASNLWDVNGGLTEEKITATLDFMLAQELVPLGLTVADVADLSHLEAVLNEIGRQ